MRAMTRRVFLGATAGVAVVPFSPLHAGARVTDRFKSSGGAGDPDHRAWTNLINAYGVRSTDGLVRVHYAAMKREAHGDLKRYVASLEAQSPTQMTRNAQFAYWANLYNSKTIDVVLDHYPVRSIKDIRLGGGGLFGGGPWKKEIMSVEGVPLSLDNVEHDILRPIWGDPRVHYAVNCASIGCPNLDSKAFTSRDLNARLDAAAAAYVNHPRGLRLEGDKVRASKIYSWFAEDFGGKRGLVPHWSRHASGALKSALAGNPRISGYDYDWGLNDV